MRITVELEGIVAEAVQEYTGIKGKSPAVARAVELFLRQERRRKLIGKALAGKTDFRATNAQLEKRSLYDPD